VYTRACLTSTPAGSSRVGFAGSMKVCWIVCEPDGPPRARQSHPPTVVDPSVPSSSQVVVAGQSGVATSQSWRQLPMEVAGDETTHR
jgi:hypothetical protein